MRYVLDASTEVLGEGTVVLGGSPLRLFRLTPAGAAQIETLVGGGDVGPSHLVDRLLASGAIHPCPTTGPFDRTDVTVVVPAWRTDPDRLTTIRDACRGVAAVIVVDDGSPVAMTAPPGVRLVRRAANGGPGAARNTGLAQVTTDLVAFVDTDVTPEPDWLDGLLAHFADERVAAVAPRVRPPTEGGSLVRYEAGHSALDLGREPARVAPGTRVSYVPAAALVARTSVLRSLGGFDEGLRTGEDVDVVWRLVESGHGVRYEPSVVVVHEVRADWRLLLRQRIGYGESAAPLARRHPGALAPVRMNGWTAVVWAFLLCGRGRAAIGVGAATSLALVRKLPGVPAATSLRLASHGHLGAGRQLASAARRVWWPLLVLGSLRSRRIRLLTVATGLSAIGNGGWRRLADDAAYGAGVWRGVIRTGELGPLVPALTPFPERRRREDAR